MPTGTRLTTSRFLCRKYGEHEFGRCGNAGVGENSRGFCSCREHPERGSRPYSRSPLGKFARQYFFVLRLFPARYPAGTLSESDAVVRRFRRTNAAGKIHRARACEVAERYLVQRLQDGRHADGSTRGFRRGARHYFRHRSERQSGRGGFTANGGIARDFTEG